MLIVDDVDLFLAAPGFDQSIYNSFSAFLLETSFSQQNQTTSNLEAWHKLWIPSIQEREEPREEAEEEASATEDGKG